MDLTTFGRIFHFSSTSVLHLSGFFSPIETNFNTLQYDESSAIMVVFLFVM